MKNRYRFKEFVLVLITVISFISCNEIVNEMPPRVIPQVCDVGIDRATICWNNAGNQYSYSVGLSHDSLDAVNSDFDTLFTGVLDTFYTITGLQSRTNYWVRVITVAGPNKPDNVSNILGFTTE